jgi:Ran GTPase-activating protein (RanGAP) involved in mRNA processing and transport
MSASPIEIKEAIEDSSIIPLFNWDICPAKFLKIFKEVIDSESKSNRLNLSTEGLSIEEFRSRRKITSEDMSYIVAFLNAYPHITDLDLTGNQIDDAGAEILALNTTLTSLNLCGNDIGPAGVKALASNTTLRILNLRGNHIIFLSFEGIEALALNKTLRTLDVSITSMNDASITILAKNRGLTNLNISHNYISVVGVQAVAKMFLIVLAINNMYLGDAAAQALAYSPTLEYLNISRCSIGIAGARALAATKDLIFLDISYNEIGPAGTRALARARNKSLRHLDIRHNNIGSTGAKALAANENLISIKVEDRIGPAGVRALAQRYPQDESVSSAPITPLFDFDTCPEKFRTIFQEAIDPKNHSLNLRCKNITHKKIGYIVEFLNSFPHITTLDISGNIGAGVQALVDTTLTTLNVSSNLLSSLEIQALFDIETLINLDISYNPIEKEVIEALARSMTLEIVNVRGCYLNDADVQILAYNTSFTDLNIRANRISDVGVQALVGHPTLNTLNIRGNRITDVGVKALLDSNITNLNVKENNISSVGVRALEESRVKKFKAQKLAFLMGTQARLGKGTSVQKFSQNSLYESKILSEIFGFLMKSDHKPDSCCTMDSLVKNEVKNVQEECEVKVAREQQEDNVDTLKLENVGGHLASHTQHRQAVTYLFGNSGSSSTSSNSVNNHEFQAMQEDHEVKALREPQEYIVDTLDPTVDEEYMVRQAISQSLEEMHELALHTSHAVEAQTYSVGAFSSLTSVAISSPTVTPVENDDASSVETPEEKRAKIDAALRRRKL